MAVTTTTASTPPTVTVALMPGKPETKMRLADIQKKDRQEQKEQDKKLDAGKSQPQSSTVVNISAKARELSRAAAVDQASSAAKTGNSTDNVVKVTGKDTQANTVPLIAQPLPPVNTGSTAAPAVTSAKKV